jgi:acetyl esterase/lipase
MRTGTLFALFSVVAAMAFAADAPSQPKTPANSKAKAEPTQRPPTLVNVAYGPHEPQVLDFWRAESPRPTPLVFHIHGGGWVNGDKAHVANLERYLDAGISIVSINYRFVTQAIEAGVKPPVQWPLADAARALQFVRSKAREWNIDPVRIGATGGSAGACSSLYLAFHADLADRNSKNPIARESTRLWCAAVTNAQTTLDPKQMKEWTPDPPIYLIYAAPPALGQDQRDPTHTANFGVKLQEKLRATGVPCELVYPGAPGVAHPQVHDYLIEILKAAAAANRSPR